MGAAGSCMIQIAQATSRSDHRHPAYRLAAVAFAAEHFWPCPNTSSLMETSISATQLGGITME